MIIQDVQQGTKEWLSLRTGKFTASEAPAMMGVSKYQTRSQLLEQKYSGVVPEVSPAQQRIFDKGHAAEAAARPIAEEIIGDELYPCTALSDEADEILASFDGITMLEDVVWEHKHINEKLRTATVETLEEHYKVQMDQQIYVSGAERCLFMASDGTRDDMVYFWYERDEKRIQALIAGWKQFAEDLENFKPSEKKVDVAGDAPESLPALNIQLSGGVTASNLPIFKEHAIAMIDSIKTKLSTDKDFADADSTVKFLKKGEKQLDDSKQAALNQTVTISELFTTIDDLKARMRDKRLQLEKLVKAEKDNRRNDIRKDAEESFSQWLSDQNSPVFFKPDINIAEAMKGKKTIESLQSAADDEVARAKIEAINTISIIKDNNNTLDKMGKDYEFLFSDRESLLIKSRDDLVNTIKARIAEHKEREEEKLRVERERLKQEEEQKDKAPEEKPEDIHVARPHSPIDTSRINAAAARYDQKQSDTVTISREEYNDLLDDRIWRVAMESAGVDSWSGYSDAMEELAQIRSEQAA